MLIFETTKNECIKSLTINHKLFKKYNVSMDLRKLYISEKSETLKIAKKVCSLRYAE